MKHRTTSEDITKLSSKEIFVFGSNESGIHGAGAAKAALSFGARMGMGFGQIKNTFAIPTKDWNIQTLSLFHIDFYVSRFAAYAAANPDLTFLVTKIGCGLAGYQVDEIAPSFARTIYLDNVHLPKEFWDILNKLID